MAKKSRRTRREENMREVAPPRVPNSMPTASVTTTGLATPTAPVATRPTRPVRPARTAEAPTITRFNSAEMERDYAFVRYDLKRILLLASTIFILLIALAFILPRFTG